MEQGNNTASWVSPFVRRLLLYSFLLFGGLFGMQLFFHGDVGQGLLFFLLPLLFLFVLLCLSFPILCFFILYVVSFVIMGLGRYIEFPLPVGVLIDVLVLCNFIVLGLHYICGKRLGNVYFTPFLLLSILWMVFCFMELLNPQTLFANWITTVRSIGIHIVLFQILVFLQLDRVVKLNYFFKCWAILVLLAALKAIGQKFIGFDSAEAHWLYTAGAHTHVIYSGIRYFSFFTDAANFGCHMGLGFVVFSILAFYERSRNTRFFYIMVALLALYGMMISGTRAAMAVPFVGLSVFVILLRKWQWVLSGAAVLVLAFCFFNFTNIGNGQSDIRRMRTAFRFTDDASFNVRLENQKKMRSFMGNYPLGLGIGSAKHTTEGDSLFGIATDSSFIFIWVETGIIGLILYIILCLSILCFGTYYVFFLLKEVTVIRYVVAAVAGLAGMMVAGYGNEVLHQIPTGITVYILMGIVMLSPYMDKKLRRDGEQV